VEGAVRVSEEWCSIHDRCFGWLSSWEVHCSKSFDSVVKGGIVLESDVQCCKVGVRGQRSVDGWREIERHVEYHILTAANFPILSLG
jgi:hypothetical protein